MTRSVKLDTAMPSLEEFGESLGLSKARQKSVVSIIKADPAMGSSGANYAVVNTRRRTAHKTGSKSTGTRKSSVATAR